MAQQGSYGGHPSGSIVLFHRKNRCSGHTLAELTVVLILIGLLGAGSVGIGMTVFHQKEGERFYRETEAVLNEILSLRNHAVMMNYDTASVILYKDRMTIKEYDSTGKVKDHPAVVFKTFTASGFNGRWEITFSPYGTVGGAATIPLIGPGNVKRNLVIQPGTGRIYLKNED